MEEDEIYLRNQKYEFRGNGNKRQDGERFSRTFYDEPLIRDTCPFNDPNVQDDVYPGDPSVKDDLLVNSKYNDYGTLRNVIYDGNGFVETSEGFSSNDYMSQIGNYEQDLPNYGGFGNVIRRQDGERFKTSRHYCRKICNRKRICRVRCNKLQEVRQTTYTRANRISLPPPDPCADYECNAPLG